MARIARQEVTIQPVIRSATRRALGVGCALMSLGMLVAACLESSATGQRRASVLGVRDTQFVIDGQPRFLLGVSLFDALGQTPPRDTDLDQIAAWGITIVRVWSHWSRPIYGPDGFLTSDGRARLLALAERLAARGLVLELVLLRPGQLPGQPYTAFDAPAGRVRAVREMTAALRPYRLVLFDLYNEHEHRDGPISHADCRALRDAVKAIDPDRLVTVSSGESHVMTWTGDLDEDGRRAIAEEAGTDPSAVHVDLLAVHLPRTADWAAATGSRIRTIRQALDRIGRRIPIYLNEENRARAGDRFIPVEQYLEAARLAHQAGAAGWVFHTAAGFDLAARSFLDALTAEERQALSRLRASVGP